MSSEPPSRPDPEGAPAEPFTRGRIQWSRPPQPVFRVGPLPRPPVAPVAAPPPRKPGAGILSGSLIPPPRAAATEPRARAAVVPPAAEKAPEAPAPPPPAPSERTVEIEPAEPAETLSPLSGEMPPVAAPRRLPSVVVTPTLYATVGAAIETVKKKDRWIVAAAVAAVVITAGFVWLATLPGAGVSDLDAPPPPAAGLAVEVTDPPDPVEAEPEPDAPPPASRVARPAVPAAASARAAAPTPVPTPATPRPRPLIETAPLAVDSPTPAEAPTGDPEAPIATAPQPLD